MIHVLFAAVLAATSGEGSVLHGFDVMVGYDQVSVGSQVASTGSVIEGKGGLAFAVGPSFTFEFHEKAGIALGVFFLYDQIGLEGSRGAISKSESFGLMSFGLQLAPTYKVVDALTLKAGYEWDVPFGGTGEVKETNRETRSYDIVWAPAKTTDYNSKSETPLSSVHNLLVGAAYDVTPGVGIAAQGKFALNGNEADYDENGSYQGPKKNTENLKVNQVSLGLAYRFRN